MTIVLIAVYVPIGFQGGLTGALFTEFAFTLVGAVTVSAIVALTLSPMMASQFLKPHGHWPANSWQRPAGNGHRSRVRAACAASTNAACMAACNYKMPVTACLSRPDAGSDLRPLWMTTSTSWRPRKTKALPAGAIGSAAPDATLAAEAALFASRSTEFSRAIPKPSHLPARRPASRSPGRC